MERIKYPAIFAVALALSHLKYWRGLRTEAEEDMTRWSIKASYEGATNSPIYWYASGRAKAAAERWKNTSKEATRALLELRELQDRRTTRRKRAARIRGAIYMPI